MQFLVDFFSWLGDIISALWNNVVSNFTMFRYFTQYLKIVAPTAVSAVSSMPLWLQTFGSITIFVCILYMILGRNGGGK